MTAPATVRGRACPLCGTPAGEPCQPKPAADHLARYLDSYTAGQLTHAYMAMTLGELVVIAPPPRDTHAGAGGCHAGGSSQVSSAVTKP